LAPLILHKPFIQIAGILDQDEADLLVSLKVPYIGFPFKLDYHSEDLSLEDGKKIIKNLPKTTCAVLITYLKKARYALELVNYLGTPIIQFHGKISVREISFLREKHPKLTVIKSLIIGKSSLSQIFSFIDDFSVVVDAFITDTFDPRSGASGATGKTHDWEVSQRIVEHSPLPVILAGGLNAGNIKQAIRKVKPAGVDVHTGVEDSNGRKDSDKVLGFMLNANDSYSVTINNLPKKKPPESE
jgi:phosphoribosylanthranilate isomerase